MTDTEIRQFRDDLIDLINNTPLLIEMKRLVLYEVYTTVSKASDDFINNQRKSIIEQLNDPNNVHESQVEETSVE
jgi:hypothetical protein